MGVNRKIRPRPACYLKRRSFSLLHRRERSPHAACDGPRAGSNRRDMLCGWKQRQSAKPEDADSNPAVGTIHGGLLNPPFLPGFTGNPRLQALPRAVNKKVEIQRLELWGAGLFLKSRLRNLTGQPLSFALACVHVHPQSPPQTTAFTAGSQGLTTCEAQAGQSSKGWRMLTRFFEIVAHFAVASGSQLQVCHL